MILTTTPSIEGRKITLYKGVVAGQAILGANIFRDFLAGVRDIVGGRSGAYENVLRDGRDAVLKDLEAEASALGADAVVAIDFDYEAIGANASMLMVSASGTAVKLD